MLKRSPFKRKAPAAFINPEREQKPNGVLYRPFNGARFDGAVIGAPKENAARSESYRRLVAALPCIHCGLAGHSQAAHADQGKGGHIKTDDRTCFPLCATSFAAPGCHDIIGASGQYTRDERRALEGKYGAATRAAIRIAGLWPADLPAFDEFELEPA